MAKVLLTRPRMRSSEQDELHRLLLEAGVTIEELPMIAFEWPPELNELDNALKRASEDEFDAIILSSPTAVIFFEDRAKELGYWDALKLNVRFGAVGKATATELESLGIASAFPIPMRGGSHELIALLGSQGLAGKRILLLQSQIGLETLEYALTEMGALPERVTLYHTTGPTLGDAARLLRLMESGTRPDVIAFFSPSSVQYFIQSLAEMASGMLRDLPALATIGETTAKAVEEALHRRPEIVARKADQASLAQDIILYLGLRDQKN